LIGENLGTLRWARGLVLNLGWDIVVPTNGEFETLYPFWIHKEELPLFESRMKDIIIELAETWSRANPIDIAHRLSLYVAAAKAANISWPDLTVALCTELSARVSDYIIWARALIEANLTGYLIFPFLLLAANKREPDWRNVVQDCLVNPETRGSAIEVVLTLPEPPEDLVDQIWPLLDPYSSLVRFICQRRALSGDLLPALLRHTSTNISSAAAYGIWNADASHVIPAPLINDWKQAVLRSNADYWLTDVFRLNPDLAYRWLQNHIADSRSFDSPLIDIIRSIISVFTYDMRCYLLDQIPGQGNYDTLIVILIGGDLTLYKHLLGNENLRRYHLTILQSRPNGEWVEKALLAHDAGYSTDDIAHATVYGTSGMEITGPASVAWVNWMKDFELLCGHENDCIKAIGEVGVVFARRNLEESQKRERYKAVFGIGL
jgi:hypothetical protein